MNRYLKNKRLLIVSNRVPYSVSRVDGKIIYKKTVGGLVTALDPLLQRTGGLWIGWSGVSGANKEIGDRVKIEGNDDFKGYELKFVRLNENEIKDYYGGFSNRTIWPLFHGFLFQSYFDHSYWKAYHRINKKFANEIVSVIENNDIVWVHDYHLMLVPEIIRDNNKDSKIIFFLHIPFPNYEILSALPWNKEIIRGLLGCDIIGFQTKKDAINFLAACKEILKLKPDFNRFKVNYNNRDIFVKEFPISIDYDNFKKIGEKKEKSKFIKNIRTCSKNTRFILSVERLDYTKGLKERFRAIERFFDKYPDYRKKVVFIQIAVPTRTKIREYEIFKKDIDEMVGRINGKFADGLWAPINYIYKSLSQEKLVTYYKLSDICLVTPLKDGMNLIAKEYIASRFNPDSVLVLSKFAGVAQELKEYAIMVNPYDVEGVADSIKDALEMDINEKRNNFNKLREIVEEKDVFYWLDSIMHSFIELACKNK
ncbi:MAG: trehalose-6-phosphate synthase [Actinomycetota bacterium]|jgi:alpha,alpha-trehalose-phosphate synthase [UDP-forming]|nr:trehalose-6-phosphate synthase [Actinomycetota bacterium]